MIGFQLWYFFSPYIVEQIVGTIGIAETMPHPLTQVPSDLITNQNFLFAPRADHCGALLLITGLLSSRHRNLI
jgi:hypothetical protein